ncbi:MAG: DUF177 domain-containing protein [Candidatus Omnitrophica bacterium]|nr:DUF177 domain-containing protein [Candidatus Omnitrophota bacterium]
MKVQIGRIGTNGMALDETFSAEFADLSNEDVLKFISPFQVKANITRAEDEVIAACVVQSRYQSFCGRCLEAVQRDWTTEFVLSFDAKAFNDFIEIDEDVRQELILNLPACILCRPDCKGLCVECGANLNTEKCKHKHAVSSGT